MLILTMRLSKKVQENILINLPNGETIKVVLHSFNGCNQARIGIAASKEIQITREKVERYDRKNDSRTISGNK